MMRRTNAFALPLVKGTNDLLQAAMPAAEAPAKPVEAPVAPAAKPVAAPRPAAAPAPALRMSPLHELLQSKGGKFAPFAGWSLPMQFAGAGAGPVGEHQHTRTAGCASLFDVSHMLPVRIVGRDRVKFAETVVAGSVASLPEGGSAYATMLCPETAGILDDLIVSRHADHVGLVLNAGRAAHDVAHLLSAAAREGGDVGIEVRGGTSMVALQGPGAAEALCAALNAHRATTMDGLEAGPVAAALPRNQSLSVAVRFAAGSAPAVVEIVRCGYTGEDGFELVTSGTDGPALASALMDAPGVKPAGLAARDTLRLEAGLCLYGSDITPDVSPLEAGLLWTCAGRRKAGDLSFYGGRMLEARKAAEAAVGDVAPEGSAHDMQLPMAGMRRVGIVTRGGPVPRSGASVCRVGEEGAAGDAVGTVTSGAPSVSRRAAAEAVDGDKTDAMVNVAMAYLPKELAKAGTSVAVKVRSKTLQGVVSKMPFVLQQSRA